MAASEAKAFDIVSLGEPMTETFDAQGRLERRELPLAHGIEGVRAGVRLALRQSVRA